MVARESTPVVVISPDTENVAGDIALPTRHEVHHHNRGIVRRRVVAGVLATAAVFTTAASEAVADVAPVDDNDATSEFTPVLTNTHPKERAIIQATLGAADDVLSASRARKEFADWARSEAARPLEPKTYKDGQKLGAFVLDYAATTKRPWTEIHNYYTSRGKTIPKFDPDQHQVHRFVNGMPTDKNLAEGVVLDPRSVDPHMLVAAMHDVTPIDAKVSVNATVGDRRLKGTYNQERMGINAVLGKGDVVHLVTPTSRDGYLLDRQYQYVGRYILDVEVEENGKMVPNDQGFDELFVGPVNEQYDFLKLYDCWEPGDDAQRMVYEFVPSGAEVIRGNVNANIGKAVVRHIE